MFTLLLNVCYFCLILLATPMVVWKRIRAGKYRVGGRQKLLGLLPDLRECNQTKVWLHAVSVGEVLQLRQVIERLQRTRPDARLLITTTTETGYSVAVDRFPECEVAFFPLDFSWCVRNALNRVCPDLIVLVELELWPNFIFAAARRKIPLVLINGRLSEKSFRGYSRIRPLVQRLLRSFSAIGVQTEEYLERFLSLGADHTTTVKTGSIKFDGVTTDPENSLTHALRDWLGIADDVPVFVAGSTQAPEEAYALKAFVSLRRIFPTLRLILVPRHPERGNDIAEMIREQGFSVRQRSRTSQSAQIESSSPVSVTPNLELHQLNRTSHRQEQLAPVSSKTEEAIGLLDTVGELGACWGLADVAFVGGSFTNRGGQNMLEPAAFGAAVCFGPNTWNFRQTVEMLLFRKAAQTVNSDSDLERFVREMLTDRTRAEEMGQRAKSFVLSQQGATDRTLTLLLEALDRGRERSQTRAA